MGDITRPYVKLGQHASGFFAPATRFKVKAGEIVQLPAGYNRDAVIMNGISGGHLAYASDAEVKEYLNRKPKTTHVAEGADTGISAALEEANIRVEELSKQLEEANAILEEMSKKIGQLEKDMETKNKSIELLGSGKEDIYKYDEAGLMGYLSENYELSKEDTKKLNKMSFEDKQNYAYDLEIESESSDVE